MGFAAALPIIGEGISAVSGLLGAKSASDRQKSAARAAQSQMSFMPSSVEQMLQQYLGNAGTPNFNARNISTDPIYQALMNSSGNAALNKSNATYQGIINGGGNQFDLSSLFGALQKQQSFTQQRGIGQLNSNAGSFGQRYGSAGQMGVADYLAQTDTNFNAQKQQIAQSSFNDAQNRLLGAAGGLMQGGNAQQAQLLQALGLSQSGAAQQGNFITGLLNLLGANMNSRLNRNASLLGAANPQGPSPLAGGFDQLGNAISLGPTLTHILTGTGGSGGGIPGIPESPIINSPYLNGLP